MCHKKPFGLPEARIRFELTATFQFMLTVLLPDVPLDRPDDPRWPAGLVSRLSRARLLARHADDAPAPAATPWEHWLGTRFEIDNPATAAAWQRFAWPGSLSTQDTDDAIPAERLLSASPASLHAGMDHLVLQHAESLAITTHEAQALADAANEYLAPEQVSLLPIAPECWVVRVPLPMTFKTASSHAAQGRNIHAYMPTGPDARALRRLLNEIQMRWHEHPVNLDRASRDLAPINTLWIDGIATQRSARPFATVYSDHAVARGLALGHGLPIDRVLATTVFESGDRPDPDDSGRLIEWRGDDALAKLGELLDRSRQPLGVVLSDERRWLALRCSPLDRLRVWRHIALA